MEDEVEETGQEEEQPKESCCDVEDPGRPEEMEALRDTGTCTPLPYSHSRLFLIYSVSLSNKKHIVFHPRPFGITIAAVVIVV